MSENRIVGSVFAFKAESTTHNPKHWIEPIHNPEHLGRSVQQPVVAPDMSHFVLENNEYALLRP